MTKLEAAEQGTDEAEHSARALDAIASPRTQRRQRQRQKTATASPAQVKAQLAAAVLPKRRVARPRYEDDDDVEAMPAREPPTGMPTEAEDAVPRARARDPSIEMSAVIRAARATDHIAVMAARGSRPPVAVVEDERDRDEEDEEPLDDEDDDGEAGIWPERDALDGLNHEAEPPPAPPVQMAARGSREKKMAPRAAARQEPSHFVEPSRFVEHPDRDPFAIDNLREWMSGFRYKPDSEYVQLSRIAPSVYAGVPTAGHLEKLFQPIDEQYLLNTWGGEQFMLEAFQYEKDDGGNYITNDRGQPITTCADRGTIRIAALPRAILGPDGKPQAITPDNNSRYLPAGMQMPQTAQGPNGQPPIGFQQVPQGAPPWGGWPQPTSPMRDVMEVAERMRLAAGDQRQADTALQAQQTQAELATKAIEAGAAGQRDLMLELAKSHQSSTAPYQASLEMLRNQLQAKTDEFRATLDTLSKEHTTQLNSLQRQHEAAQNASTRQIEAQIAAIRDDARAREENARAAARGEVTALQSDLAQARSDIAEARRLADRERSELRAQYEQRERDVSNQFAQRETALRDEANRREAAAKTDADRRETHARDAAKVQYEGQIQSLRDQLAATEKQLEARLADAKDQGTRYADLMVQGVKAELQGRVDAANMMINQLQGDLTAARNEAAQARDAASQQQDPLAVMAKTREMAEAAGFVRADAQPQGFMGQLAQAAPSIGEYLVKPALKVMSDGVEVAKQAQASQAAQRQAYLDNMRMQQQAAMQPMPAPAVPAPHPLPPPLPRNYQPRPTPQAQPAVQAQPAQAVQATPVATPAPPAAPEPVAGEGPTAEQIEQVKPIAFFLEAALVNGQSASDVVRQAREYTASGFIPPNFLSEIKSADRDYVIGELQGMAAVCGAPTLSSPRGEEFIGLIYDELKRN